MSPMLSGQMLCAVMLFLKPSPKVKYHWANCESVDMPAFRTHLIVHNLLYGHHDRLLRNGVLQCSAVGWEALAEGCSKNQPV